MVELRGLSAGYGSRVVLSHDALHIGPGEHTLLLGPSGCGKTTLLNILAGLAEPLSGEVWIDGTLMSALSESQRDRFRGQKIGLIMQRLHLINALNIQDNLRLTQRLVGHSADPVRIHEVLTALGLADKGRCYPATLSQGEAQRVAVARAVMNRPSLILADEPTAALDDANCGAAIRLLFEQAERHGATLVVATHDARIKPHFARWVQM
ncbi:MAG: ABC transporter ATP-binding protein [Betaproteobacteria bacterium]|nr:ABC transporter ATP-binding protein [Betaproteobacteria bacterium]